MSTCQLEKNLCSLLYNKDFVELLLAEKPANPDVLITYDDGERCQQHYLFNDHSKLSLKLQLFYDGMGTVNPLRAQSSSCNVGVFYYTLQNIPPVIIPALRMYICWLSAITWTSKDICLFSCFGAVYGRDAEASFMRVFR